MSTTNKGNVAIFLAVDMFTGYIQLKAIKSRKTEDLIEAIKSTIILPFGTPKLIRSDNETGIQNSAEFKTFIEQMNIELAPCSTASPWSNGAAERAVQTIKKSIRTFIQMEKDVDNWDDYIHFYAQSHNKSTNVHGYTPEELHFGFTNPDNNELIEIWPKFENQEVYMDRIVKLASKNRAEARAKVKETLKKNITYRNQKRTEKSFKVGEIVIHRQLTSFNWYRRCIETSFYGALCYTRNREGGASAILEHLHTKRQIHAHFSNLQIFLFDPATARLPSKFDDLLADIHIEKDSEDIYYPKAKIERKLLNEQNREKLHRVNVKFDNLDTEMIQDLNRETDRPAGTDGHIENDTPAEIDENIDTSIESDSDIEEQTDSDSDTDRQTDTVEVETDVETERRTDAKTDTDRQTNKRPTTRSMTKGRLTHNSND